MSRLVDLSFVVEASPRDLPAFMRIEVEYSDHAQGAAEFEQLLGVDRRLLRDEEGPAGERLSIGTHATTHVDAPWHYNSRIAGAPAATIDELPLDWFYGPGVVVDARAKADGDPVTRAEMEQGIADAGHALAPRDIVLVHTGATPSSPSATSCGAGRGVTPDATRWLYEQGVRVMGIDAWGWDAPLDVPGQGRQGARRAGDLVGRPSGGHPVLADRAAHEPRGAAGDGLHGRVLPAEDQTSKRRTRARGGDPGRRGMIEDHRGDVLLVGSLPFETAEEAMRAAAEHLGDHLPAFGDGEVGLRKLWIGFLPMTIYSKHPQLEVLRAPEGGAPKPPTDGKPEVYEAAFLFGIKPGEELRFETTSYGPIAVESYGVFERLRDEGVVPEGVRFQVTFPGTGSAISYFFREEDWPAAHAAYHDAIRRDIELICEHVPARGPADPVRPRAGVRRHGLGRREGHRRLAGGQRSRRRSSATRRRCPSSRGGSRRARGWASTGVTARGAAGP